MKQTSKTKVLYLKWTACLGNPDSFTYYKPPLDKTNKMAVCPAKTQISLGICPVCSVFADAQWVAYDSSFLHADSKDLDQPGQMPRLI